MRRRKPERIALVVTVAVGAALGAVAMVEYNPNFLRGQPEYSYQNALIGTAMDVGSLLAKKGTIEPDMVEGDTHAVRARLKLPNGDEATAWMLTDKNGNALPNSTYQAEVIEPDIGQGTRVTEILDTHAFLSGLKPDWEANQVQDGVITENTKGLKMPHRLGVAQNLADTLRSDLGLPLVDSDESPS